MEGGDLCLRKTTAGVDLNRNWEYAWTKVGSTRRGFQFVSDTCSNYHLDPQAASQIKLLLPYLTGRGGQ